MADWHPTEGVEEIPFDVAEWGYRVVPPVYESEEERQAFLKERRAHPDEDFQKLRQRAAQLEKERLG